MKILKSKKSLGALAVILSLSSSMTYAGNWCDKIEERCGNSSLCFCKLF